MRAICVGVLSSYLDVAKAHSWNFCSCKALISLLHEEKPCSVGICETKIIIEIILFCPIRKLEITSIQASTRKCSTKSHYSRLLTIKTHFCCCLLFDDFAKKKKKRNTSHKTSYDKLVACLQAVHLTRMKFLCFIFLLFVAALSERTFKLRSSDGCRKRHQEYVNLQHKFRASCNGLWQSTEVEIVRNHVPFHNKKRNSGKTFKARLLTIMAFPRFISLSSSFS